MITRVFRLFVRRPIRLNFRLEAGTARRCVLNEKRVSTQLEPAGGASL